MGELNIARLKSMLDRWVNGDVLDLNEAVKLADRI